jgi:hypothetical protein
MVRHDWRADCPSKRTKKRRAARHLNNRFHEDNRETSGLAIHRIGFERRRGSPNPARVPHDLLLLIGSSVEERPRHLEMPGYTGLWPGGRRNSPAVEKHGPN